MRVKVEATEKGPVPSETVVTIATTVGTEDVIVHTSQVTEDGVEVGFIGSEEDGEASTHRTSPGDAVGPVAHLGPEIGARVNVGG